MHKVHKNVIVFCSALSLAILSTTLMIATRNDSSTDVQLPVLFSLDPLNNRTLIGEPSYTEWGKQISSNYLFSNDIHTVDQWNKSESDTFTNGLVIETKILPEIVSLMLYKPSSCKEGVFTANETEYFEICGNSARSLPCSNTHFNNEVIAEIPTNIHAKISSTCYALSIFTVCEDNSATLKSYMTTWFFYPSHYFQ